MPMVEAQVKNQIPLHDLSNTSVSIAPADYSSWHEVRTELMGEAKAGLKARVEAELAAAADDNELKALRDRFAAEERAIEHQIDHDVHQFSCALEVRLLPTMPCHTTALTFVPYCLRSSTTSSPSRRPSSRRHRAWRVFLATVLSAACGVRAASFYCNKDDRLSHTRIQTVYFIYWCGQIPMQKLVFC